MRAACGVLTPSTHSRVHHVLLPTPRRLAGCGDAALLMVQWIRGGHMWSILDCRCSGSAHGACWLVPRVAHACLGAYGAGGLCQAAAAAQDGLYSSCCHWAILPPGPNGQDSVAFSIFSQHIACTCASTCESVPCASLEKNVKPLRAVWYQLLI